MKKVIENNFLIIFFSLFCSINVTFAGERPVLAFDDLQKETLKEFKEELEVICRSKFFFKNLKNHSTYPKFGTEEIWKRKCSKLKSKTKHEELATFFQKNFKPYTQPSNSGLLTGYYEPTINVSRTKNKIFKYPILRNKKYYHGKARNEIEATFRNEDVLLWTDDKVNLFFLHIQGSGLGKFKNKKLTKILYDGNNKLSYTSIGKHLIKKKFIREKDVNLFSIKNWLRKNKDLSEEVMNVNKRFIFFKESFQDTRKFPSGAMGLPLAPDKSIAVDNKIYPIGIPFLIEFLNQEPPKLAVSLDTGAAIKGKNRADLFTGRGMSAEKKAGLMKKKIYLHPLIPYID